MTSIFRSVVSLLLGLALAAYGLVHTPDPLPRPGRVRPPGRRPAQPRGRARVRASASRRRSAGSSSSCCRSAGCVRGWRHLRAVTAARTSGVNGRGPIARGYGYPPDGEDEEIEPGEREWVPSAIPLITHSLRVTHSSARRDPSLFEAVTATHTHTHTHTHSLSLSLKKEVTDPCPTS